MAEPEPPAKRAPAKTSRERADAKRLEKLDNVQQQIESGSLTVRQMTDEERKQNPPRPRPPKRGGR